MYKFCTDISEQECLQYLQTLPHYNVLQTPMWAQVKPNWTHQIVGVRNENGELVATALLLIRKLMPGSRIIYSPRGLMIDYHNPELLKTMVNGVLEVAKKRKAYVVRIDPEIEIAQIYKGQKVSDEAGLEAMNELKNKDFSTWDLLRIFTLTHSLAFMQNMLSQTMMDKRKPTSRFFPDLTKN